MSRGGIPLKTPGGKASGLNFYVTHKPSEGYAALGMILCCVALAWSNDFLSGEYLSKAVDLGIRFVTNFFQQL